MNKLKKWVLAPVACLAVLYIWLLAGSRIGYIWTFAIESVVILAVIFAFSSKFKGETGKKITKDIITVLGGIWGIIAIANIGTWLGSKIGFLWAFLIISGIIAVGAFVLDPKKAKEYLKKRTSTRVVVGTILAILAGMGVYFWLGVQIGFFWTLLLLSVIVVIAVGRAKNMFGEQGAKRFTMSIIWALVCVWGVTGYIWISRIPPAPPMDQTNDVWVQVQAQEILRNFLKSPSTAKFPSTSSATIERYKDNFFFVSSYVDAQNSFGVPIRNTWSVLFHVAGSIVDPYVIVLDGEALLKRDIPK